MNDLYVLVDHNQKMIIDHIRKLPENWNNIHGLNLLTSEKLFNLDWAGQIGLGWVDINNQILDNYNALPEWFEISKSGLKKLLSDERWKREHDIINFKSNTLELNERTKNALNFYKVGLNSETLEIKWKFIGGFVSLTSEEFLSLYNFTTEYIQGCFNEEERLVRIYNSANNLKELLKLNLNENWPSPNFE